MIERGVRSYVWYNRINPELSGQIDTPTVVFINAIQILLSCSLALALSG